MWLFRAADSKGRQNGWWQNEHCKCKKKLVCVNEILNYEPSKMKFNNDFYVIF